MREPFLLAVMGSTGSGKSDLAEYIASRFDAQLINADAFHVYRGMSIGTNKPVETSRYRLIDLKDPSEEFGVGEFVRLAHAELTSLYAQGRSAVLVGGSGLYVRALMEEYEQMAAPAHPELRMRLNQRHAAEGLAPLVEELSQRAPLVAQGLDLQNPARVKRALERLETGGSLAKVVLPPYRRLKVALSPDPMLLECTLKNRICSMVQNGWVQEVRDLLLGGYGPNSPGFRAIGYRTFARHAQDEIGLEEASAITLVETRRYAKRQRTWLRSEPNLTVINPDRDGARLDLERRIELLFV